VDAFFGSNDPTNSVKALKEVRTGFNPPGPPHRVTKLRLHTTHSNTPYKNESKHSEMGPVRQTQSRELLGLFICVCVHCTVHNCCTQYCTEQTW